MSYDDDLYRFLFNGDTVVSVEEYEHGRWEREDDDDDETWTLENGQVVKTEVEHGRITTEVYQDLNGDGLYQQVSDQEALTGTASGYHEDDDVSLEAEYDHHENEVDEDESETWTLENGQLIKTEVEHGAPVTEVYQDLNGDGLYQQVSESSYLEGSPVPVLPETEQADDNSIPVNNQLIEAEAEPTGVTTGLYQDLSGNTLYQQTSENEVVDEPSISLGEHNTDTPPLLSEDGAQLVRLYLSVLDRLPDESGFNNWLSALNSGVEFDDIIESFLSAQEFSTKYGNLSNNAFVGTLYQNVLDRDPDDEGQAWWTAQLDSGAAQRQDVVRGFSESTEFHQHSESDVSGFLISIDDNAQVLNSTLLI